MTDTTQPPRILGSLRTEDGQGVVRIEDRLNTDISDAWSAVTDPVRLARWYGEVEGDLRVGGEYRARVFTSGWEGMSRIDSCDPPHGFVVTGQDPDEPNPQVTTVKLTADGDHTLLVVEKVGVPIDLLPAYGAGTQVIVEDLESYLAGDGRCDADARWQELEPAYDALAAESR